MSTHTQNDAGRKLSTRPDAVRTTVTQAYAAIRLRTLADGARQRRTHTQYDAQHYAARKSRTMPDAVRTLGNTGLRSRQNEDLVARVLKRQ